MSLKKMVCRSCVCIVLLAALAGCGGGGGNSGTGSAAAGSGTASLAWEKPTTYSDGTPVQNLSGFTVHYGTESKNYTMTQDVGTATNFTVTGLAPGVYYFAVTAYDADGNQSDYSNEQSKTIM